MTTLIARIELQPGKLWIIRLAVRLAGATLKVWVAKPRKAKEGK